MPFEVTAETAARVARDGKATLGFFTPPGDDRRAAPETTAGYMAAQFRLKGYRADVDGPVVHITLPEGR